MQYIHAVNTLWIHYARIKCEEAILPTKKEKKNHDMNAAQI